MTTSGFGRTLAASTREAAQNYPRQSILCIGSTQTQGCAMRTSMISMAPSSPLEKMVKGIPTQTGGRSGVVFTCSGRCR